MQATGMVDDHLCTLRLGLAVDDHTLAGREDFLNVVGIEPADAQQRAERVALDLLEGRLEHLAAAPESLGGGGNDDPANAHRFVTGGIGKALKLAAVLVATGIMTQEIAYRRQVKPG